MIEMRESAKSAGYCISTRMLDFVQNTPEGCFQKRFIVSTSSKDRGTFDIVDLGLSSDTDLYGLNRQRDPVPLTTETNNRRTWWIYRGKFYWEDFSAREVAKK